MARKTEQENELRGNPGHRKSKPSKSIKPIAPSMPNWLDSLAKEHWREIVPVLLRYGMVTELDGPTLAAMCAAHGRAIAAEKVLSQKGKNGGSTFRSPNGHICQRPEVAIAQNSWKAYYQYAEKFGMTPSARAKLGIVPENANGGEDAEENDYYEELDD